MTPEISRALAEIASGLELTPAVRQDLLAQVPSTAQTEADLPEHLRFLLTELRQRASAPLARTRAAAAATNRTLTLAGRPLTFSTELLTRQEMCGNNEPHFNWPGPDGMPHPDDDGSQALRPPLPERWRGLLVPYDTMAPDGRVISAPPDMVPKSRQMPLPLNVQVATAEGHENAIPVGRVNRIWSKDGALWGEGEFDLATPEGRDWAGRVGRQMAGWGSVDLDAESAPVVSARGEDKVPRKQYDDWTFAGFTLVTRPAFDAARIGPYLDEQDVIDDENNCLTPDDVADILDGIRDSGDDQGSGLEQRFAASTAQILASDGGCGCGGASEPDAKVTFPAGGKSGLPIGDRGAEWDAGAAIGRVRAWAGVDGAKPDWNRYGQAFFWHAPNPSKLGDFKLPFADVVDGKLTAMPRGIFAAAAAMQGSRGSKPDIPAADAESVRSKISAYYRKMKMKAPWDSSAMTASAAHGSNVRIDGGIEGVVTGFDNEGGWLRIACGPSASVVCSVDELPAEGLTASASISSAPPDEWFADPQLAGPTALSVDDDGRIYGHLAVFGTCHTSFSDTCVTPPRSATAYGYFHTGEIATASGKRIAAGKIVIGGGHAAPHAGWRASASHYDKTSSTAAVVRAGEDAYGIWVAGSLVPEATPAQIAALRRSPLSGDWRRIAGSMELVAALAVNVPGFPIPRARAGFTASRQASLVASGVVDRGQVALNAQLTDVVQAAVENVLEGYADRRQRAAAAAARIAAASAASVGMCAGECTCAGGEEDFCDEEDPAFCGEEGK
jgi:hypothetical protein